MTTNRTLDIRRLVTASTATPEQRQKVWHFLDKLVSSGAGTHGNGLKWLCSAEVVLEWLTDWSQTKEIDINRQGLILDAQKVPKSPAQQQYKEFKSLFLEALEFPGSTRGINIVSVEAEQVFTERGLKFIAITNADRLKSDLIYAIATGYGGSTHQANILLCGQDFETLESLTMHSNICGRFENVFSLEYSRENLYPKDEEARKRLRQALGLRA
jgi:hypothetical protein